MALDMDIIDKENVCFITDRYKQPVMAVYRTGSTVTGNTKPDSDVDYLVVLDSDGHYRRDYRMTRDATAERPKVDIVAFTRGDLILPSSIREGRVDKLAYLMRETTRPRIHLYGQDCFEHLLDRHELYGLAGSLGIGPHTMAFLKGPVAWE